MPQLHELHINHLPNLSPDELDLELDKLQLTSKSSWLLPQLVHYFSTWEIRSNGRDMVTWNCKTDFDRALWFLTRLPRSKLIKNQVLEPTYAQFTPLILLAQRRYRDYPYEWWRTYPGLDWIMEPRLLESVRLENLPSLGSEELLEIRDRGLRTRGGKPKSAVSTWSLVGIEDTRLAGLPKLTQTMLTQCWLAHPTKRCETMILDPNNWDEMPKALTTTEIFETNTKTTAKSPSIELPWD